MSEVIRNKRSKAVVSIGTNGTNNRQIFRLRNIKRKAIANKVKPTPNYGQVFEDIHDHLKADRFMLENDIAPKEIAEMYNALMNKDFEAVLYANVSNAKIYYQYHLWIDFMQAVKKENINPIEMGFRFSGHQFTVIAIVPDEDELIERALISAELTVSNKYYSKGFTIDLIIYEESDGYIMPNEYKLEKN